MRKKLSAVLLSLALLVSFGIPAYAKPIAASAQTSSTAAISRLQSPDKAQRSKAEGKLDSRLLQLVDSNVLPKGKTRADLIREMRGRKQISDIRATNGTDKGETVSGVKVYVRLKDTATIDALLPYVLKISNRDEKDHLAACVVDVDRLTELADLDCVASVQTIDPPVTCAGAALSQGDSVLKVEEVRDQYGIDGSGMKIGVISDGVDNLSSSVSSGDLPSNVHVLSNTVGGDEGTAMLEIVHDLAPGAALYFHDCGDDWLAFNDAIDELIASGCNVIVDDISWISSPFFEDGVVATHIKEKLQSNNIVYVTAAGNFATCHYQGLFHDDGTGHQDFSTGSGSDSDLIISVGAYSSAIVILEWDEPFYGATSDYDLYLYDDSTSPATELGSGVGDQSSSNLGLEYVVYQNDSAHSVNARIEVEAYNAPTPRTIEILTTVPIVSDNGTAADSIFGQAAVPGVIACGAADQSTPDDIEYFSSQGPVTLLSGTRQKPDVTAVDGVAVTGAGGFPDPFYGTSAAAPHVAAVAALLMQRFPGKTAAEIKGILTGNAVDLGSTGYDPVYGYGRVDALAAAKSYNYVHFDAKGGSAVTAKLVAYNGKISSPTATKTGYALAGWYKEAACTNAWNFASDTVTSDITLYAKWTINTYSVTFNAQGGSSVAGTSAAYGSKITAPQAPTRSGYTFGGWYKEAACTNAWNFASDTVTNNLILYAKWTPNTCTIAFDSRGGSAVAGVTVLYNARISAPKSPTRKGFTFGGWYKEAACQNAWNFAADTVTQSTTLYARWLVTVSASSSSTRYGTVSGVGQYAEGAQATLTATPKSGYYFVKWTEGSRTVSTDPTYTFTAASGRTLKAYFAAIPTPSISVKQTKYSAVLVSWKSVSCAKGYEIYRSTNSRTGFVKVGNVEGALQYQDSNLAAGTTYYYKVRAYCVTLGVTSYGNYCSAKKIAPNWAIPSLSVKTSEYHTANLAWNAIAEAKGYEIWRSTSKSSGFAKIADVTATAYADRGLEAGHTYYYKVLPYDVVDSVRVAGRFSSVRYMSPKWPSVRARASAKSQRSVLVSWNAVSGAGGYEVWMATSSKGEYKLLATDLAATTYSVDRLAVGTYYFKVRAYKVVNSQKVYGPMSGYSAAKLRWPSLSIKTSVQGYFNVQLSWVANAYADGYRLYRSTSKSTGYVQIGGDITATAYTDTLPDALATYYYKVQPYYTDGNGVFRTGPLSGAKSVKANWPTVRLSAKLQSDKSVLFSWTAVANAAGYEVSWAASSRGPFALLQTAASASCTATGLAPGTYYFRVRPYVTSGSTTFFGKASGTVRIVIP